ncbi:MAG: hypothetical protein IT386_09715 [Deltaproteobacteria bacterium]|nr:hypothetical protein [Deltaproteobacteria bacterium]
MRRDPRLRGLSSEHHQALGERLHAHVRFEEHELFPVCEALLPDAALAEVARRAPKDERRRSG